MFSSLKFTSKITIAASLVLVLVLGIFTINNYFSMRHQTQEQLSLVLKQSSQSVSQNIASWLNNKLAIVISLAKTYQVEDAKALTLSQLNTAEMAGDFKNTYIGKATNIPKAQKGPIKEWFEAIVFAVFKTSLFNFFFE